MVIVGHRAQQNSVTNTKTQSILHRLRVCRVTARDVNADYEGESTGIKQF